MAGRIAEGFQRVFELLFLCWASEAVVTGGFGGQDMIGGERDYISGWIGKGFGLGDNITSTQHYNYNLTRLTYVR